MGGWEGGREGGRSLHIIQQKRLEVSKEALLMVVSCAQLAGYETANEITRKLEGKGLVPEGCRVLPEAKT